MKRMARMVLMVAGVLWGAGAWGGLAPEAGSATASDGTVLQTPEAGTVLKGVAYPVNGGGTMWSFDAYRWGETAPRDVTVRFVGEGGAVSALGWRGGNGTFGTDAGTRWGLDETGVYAVVDTYRPGAIAPGALAGRTIAWSFLIFWEFE